MGVRLENLDDAHTAKEVAALVVRWRRRIEPGATDGYRAPFPIWAYTRAQHDCEHGIEPAPERSRKTIVRQIACNTSTRMQFRSSKAQLQSTPACISNSWRVP